MKKFNRFLFIIKGELATFKIASRSEMPRFHVMDRSDSHLTKFL